MKRREFIAALGGAAAAWPLTLSAKQTTSRVVGALNTLSPDAAKPLDTALRRGLSEAGYVEGRNVVFEYRYGQGQYDRLPALASELVRRQVSVIVAGGTPAAVAAKAATATIPIVFTTGSDPVKLGLVASLNRPGRNITGVSFFIDTLGGKRMELLGELLPTAPAIGFLVNPANPDSEFETRDVQTAAHALGQQLEVQRASNERDIDAAFANFSQRGINTLMLSPDAFFLSRRDQLVALAARYSIPVVYYLREFVVAGGLMSYGGSITDSFRLAGVYAARILKGEKPAGLPVHQAVKVELVINLKTAKSLGLTVLPTLLARADEVIE
jgi:ABC-type uncharacterized transport system substrate-binding protein